MTNATITDRCAELATLITRHTDGKGNGFHNTVIDRLGFSRESAVGTVMHGISAPMLAIVVQGRKDTLMGEETYHYGAAQYLVSPSQFSREYARMFGAAPIGDIQRLRIAQSD